MKKVYQVEEMIFPFPYVIALYNEKSDAILRARSEAMKSSELIAKRGISERVEVITHECGATAIGKTNDVPVEVYAYKVREVEVL